jgi:hypothetical protein
VAANSDVTMTIDTSEVLYESNIRKPVYITNASTITFKLTADATVSSSSIYTVIGSSLALDDGRKLKVDRQKSWFKLITDNTYVYNQGSLWIEEDNGRPVEWKFRQVKVDNVDQPTLFNAVLERGDDEMITMTFTDITMSQ